MIEKNIDNISKRSGGLRLNEKFKSNDQEKPLISIITITLNSSKTLQETINSILEQSYKNFEIIIIDGNSSDNTIDIIKNNEGNIDYWISEQDDGIFHAFNKGLRLARGEYIGFVNSDDTLENNALEILVRYFKKHPNLDFLFGSVKKNWGVRHGYKPWMISFSWGFYSAHSCGFFIKNSSSKIVGLYDTNLKCHSDWDYFYRMIKIHKLKGMGTKKNELFGNFKSGGFSSKISFIDSTLETIKIRKKNGQAKLFILIISTIKFIKNLSKFKSLRNNYIQIFNEIYKN